MGVPTDLPHENRVSQLAKNTDKQSVAATNRSEEGLDIPKSRKKLDTYTDLVSWIIQGTLPAAGRPWRLCSLPRRITGRLIFLYSRRVGKGESHP